MRKLLFTLPLTLLIWGCTTAQVQETEAQIESAIQVGAAALCGILPTVSTIVNVVGVLYPPAVTIASLTQAEISNIESAICTATLSPAANARLKAAASPGAGAPSTIGTFRGVPIVGWRTQ